MFSKSPIARLSGTAGTLLLTSCLAAFALCCMAGTASAAGIKVVPSASKVTPGESFYADVVVEGIPAEGLGAIQFRLNVSAPGSTVAPVSDTAQGQPGDISVSSPLIVGPATTSRSGVGDFFWNSKGSHGILVMDNEILQNGSALYTLGQTNGAALPSGSGTVARFQINAGSQAAAEKIVISLVDVALLEGSTVYPVENNTGATVDLKCYTQAPNLIGLSGEDATAALTTAKLSLGTAYELDNSTGTHALNAVLVQSVNAGTTLLCETAVDLAINTAPSEVTNVHAVDKAGDESGTAVLSWLPSPSSDTAGYRVYNASGVRVSDIVNAASTGVEMSGLALGQASPVRITAYDAHGNESSGVIVYAAAVDDVAPRITVSGISNNVYYPSDVQPVITVQDENLAFNEITLNGISYAQLPISVEGNYLLKVTATDTAGNSSVKEIAFTVDKTPPAISVAGIAKGIYYNTDLSPIISVTDADLEMVETSLNGDAYTSGTLITAENNYELRIQARDKAGNSLSEVYAFFIDKTRPTSTMTIGSPTFESNGLLYVAGATPLTLAGSDPGTIMSGVDKLEYRTNEAAWNVYQTPAALAGMSDGPLTLDYRAVDRATNTEEYHTLAVTLDTTVPVTTLASSEPRYIGPDGSVYVTQNTSFTLSTVDALSGVAMAEFKLDAGPWITAAPFWIPAEGSHTILYHSRDNVANSEPDKTFAAIVDNTPPLTTITTNGQQFTAADGKLYITDGTTVTLAAADNLSGIAATEYRIDGGAWTTYSPFAILTEGTHTIDYYSKDNVSNAETFKTLAVLADKTPPVTTIMTGEPKYTAADGKLYVTGSTTFILSATDNISGAALTEYRIDGGEWTTYAPFTIASEGMHSIDYYSRDNVLNTETFKTLAVIVDNAAPVSTVTVGVPQYPSEGKLYVSSSTGVTITAVDAVSGVSKVEYSIDGGPWSAYTTMFTLSSYNEGTRTIRYRSVDNLDNRGDIEELAVILDKTAPQTSISASDPLIEGVINTVSPSTSFSLMPADALSGVRTAAYRINNGAWQVYSGSFSLAGMKAGQYTLAYRATDNVLNEEAETSITVRLIIMEMEKKTAADSIILVGVESDNSDLAQKQADLQMLNRLLTSLNLTYTVTETVDDFTIALRSGRYNTYILIDVKDPLIGGEIRESVFSGDGLIFIKTKPNADPFLDDAFGLKFSGKTTSDNLTITLQESPVSIEGSLRATGKSIVSAITSTTAQMFGSVLDKKDVYPAVVFNQYERGKVLLYTFDLLNADDQSLASALLIESLNFVRPAAQTSSALGSAPIRITVTNSTEPVEMKMIESLPYGATVDTVVPRVTPVDDTLTWQKSMTANERAGFGYYLNLPDAAGSYLTKTELAYNNNGFFRTYGQYELMLTVQNSSGEQLGMVLADLRALAVKTVSDADRVAKAIDLLMLVDTNAGTRRVAEDNIKLILQAIEEVRMLSIDAPALRTGLDELLKVWERKWYLLELIN